MWESKVEQANNGRSRPGGRKHNNIAQFNHRFKSINIPLCNNPEVGKPNLTNNQTTILNF